MTLSTEADTCRKYVLPKLIDAGWDNEPHSFTEQRTFTDGRIVVSGDKIYRRPQKRAKHGVCARIKEELLKNFNLHTIVRLPNGVFAPYTSIPTNLLFFDQSGPTKEIWYYEQPLPEGRKNYTKTQPLQLEEFKPCLDWWKKRKENDHAWKVPAAELRANNCNLDRKNPHAKEDISHLPPEKIVESILQKEQKIMEIMGRIKALLEKPL